VVWVVVVGLEYYLTSKHGLNQKKILEIYGKRKKKFRLFFHPAERNPANERRNSFPLQPVYSHLRIPFNRFTFVILGQWYGGRPPVSESVFALPVSIGDDVVLHTE